MQADLKEDRSLGERIWNFPLFCLFSSQATRGSPLAKRKWKQCFASSMSVQTRVNFQITNEQGKG